VPKKKTIIVTALILALACGGLILGWKDQDALAQGKTSAEEITVDMTAGDQDAGFSSEIIELTNDSGQNYFVNYRIKREQFRQETKDMLAPLLNSDILAKREEAQERWLVLSNQINQESEIENILKMQGFQDVVSEVNRKKISIIVLTPKLTLQDIAIIKKAVTDITGFSSDNIQVTART
jgi:stage III sporulation protein AH